MSESKAIQADLIAPETAHRWLARVGSIGLLGAMLGGWQAASTQTFVIPSVGATLNQLVLSVTDASFRSDFLYTVTSIGLAFLIGILAGSGVGFILGYVATLRKGFESVIVSLNSVPKIILYPLLLPIFQVGQTSQVIMGVMHAMFPILLMTAAAVASVPSIYTRMAQSLGASRRQILWHVTLPAVRKAFLTGCRLAISLASIGVILAEFFSSRYGLGRVMARSYEFGQYDALMSSTLTLLAVSFAGSAVIYGLEKRQH